MTVQEVKKYGIDILKKSNVEDANIVANILLANILEIKKDSLILNYDKEISEEKKEKFFDGISKIADGYPLEYLTNTKEFMKMNFYVDESVLVPRADTEVLVENTINLCKEKKDVLELCTGSGIIAISLEKYVEGLSIIATDISKEALNVARRNENNLIPDGKIKFVESDMFENVEGKFDIIVSNPPYVKRDIIKDYILKYEPHIALDRTE